MEPEYLAQLNDKERLALSIARRMLGPSFNLSRSIGYVQFVKTRPATDASKISTR